MDGHVTAAHIIPRIPVVAVQTTDYRDGLIGSFCWDCGDVNDAVSSLVTDDPLREITASIGCS